MMVTAFGPFIAMECVCEVPYNACDTIIVSPVDSSIPSIVTLAGLTNLATKS